MNQVIPFFVAVGMERGSEQYIRLAADPTLEDVSELVANEIIDHHGRARRTDRS